ncbi:hypothetical protein [Prosthecobacter sp.]|uniref:hypothetical protein n=1 Tax=Prosthecobacter sp. TaxID=1965333 RepID=UPI003782F7A0
MTPISFTAFTDAGCMVIFDPASGFQPTDEWLHCMNHFTDPDGRSHLSCDYPEGDWQEVWQRNVSHLRQLSSNGEFTLLLCEQVEHACQISDELPKVEQARLRCSFEEWVHAPSGRVIISDPMSAFSGLLMEDEPFVELMVTPGWNKVIIHSLAEPPDFENVEGFEGNEKFPALVFCISPSAMQPTEKRDGQLFPRMPISQTRSAGGLCKATVIDVTEGVAKLRLHASASTTSGWGRLKKADSAQVHAGAHLTVRLVQHTKAYWLVEMP